MKKIILIFITINLLITNLYSQKNERIVEKNEFDKLELTTNELSKLFSKRFKIVDSFVNKANEKNDKLKMPSNIEKLNLLNNFKIDSLRIDEYFSFQRKISGLIVKSILTLEQYSNLEKDKIFNKRLDKLESIEQKLKIASKQYNLLIDTNKIFQDYPRIGGSNKSEIDFDINFD